MKRRQKRQQVDSSSTLGVIEAPPFAATNARRSRQEGDVERENRYTALKAALAAANEARQKAPLASLQVQHSALTTSRQTAYQELIFRIRNNVASTLPQGASVLVVSKGDPALIKLSMVRAAHFPQNDHGAYAGHYPSDSAAAIDHLEQLRGAGAEYLLLPNTAFWWLEFYAGFRRHLESRYATTTPGDRSCVIFDLRRQIKDATTNSAGVEATPIPASSEIPTNDTERRIVSDLVSETEIRLELAESLLAIGQLSDAYAVLLEGRQQDPDNVRLLVSLAKYELGLGNERAASEYVEKALAIAPDDSDVVLQVARLDSQRGRLDIAEERLKELLEIAPTDETALTELAGLYCTQLEDRASGAVDGALLSRLAVFITRPATLQRLSFEMQLRVAECLGELGEIRPALTSLKAALRKADFKATALQDFVLRLLRSSFSDRSRIPFHDPGQLAALLTHLGNGFTAVQDSFRASACYLLASAASSESQAANFNLAFRALAEGSPLEALECLSKASRVYADDAAQICWPAERGTSWPRAPFNLTAAFEALKPTGATWPAITVITPSYNQASYIEDTLLSVLNQHYPTLQYIVVDGDSTDGSADVLRRYETHLDRLIIEPDHGQTDAINKGLRLAAGELILWINSDDMLAPGALYMMALAYLEQPSDLIAGFCLEHAKGRFNIINLPAVSQGTFNTACLGEIFQYWLKGHYFYQPEVAFSRRILQAVGGELDQSLYYTMDYDFWLKCAAAGGEVSTIHWPVALFRKHDAQKTANLDATVIEQGRVRDRYVTPRPCLERKIEIRSRVTEALRRPIPEIAVISTRASKIFSPDTGRELRETFANDGMNVSFYDAIDPAVLTSADLVISLVHIYKEHAALRKAREDGCQTPIVGWFWDNHHHVFDNYRTASDLDICIPGHSFASSYLRSAKYLTAAAVPLCVTQWSAAEAAEFFTRYGRSERSDALYGGFVRYSMAAKRNRLIEQVIDAGMSGVYFLEEHALDRYFGMSLDKRFEAWTSHKASLCLPLAGDLSQRLFDALLTGQVPIVPDDVYDLDQVIPPSAFEELPILRLSAYHPDAVKEAHTRALECFNRQRYDGALQRHQYALKNHVFLSRVRSIISSLQA
jgi:glycosyltransferase involved in cell wall biosynthesis